MSKYDNLRKLSGEFAAESMGAAKPATMHGASAPAVVAPDRLQGVVRSKNAAEIPVGRIMPDPDQPREEFDPESLQRLADSLRSKGQLQPIRVRWDEGRGLYVIICGERRWRAAGLAGMANVQCIISDAPVDAGELLILQLIENCVREDLRPIEQARAFRSLMDINQWSTRQISRELGVDQSNVVRALAMLELPTAIQDQVEAGTLAPSVAYEVSKIEDPIKQNRVAERVVAEGMTRTEAKDVVRAAVPKKIKAKKAKGLRRPAPKPRMFKTSMGRVIIEPRYDDLEAMLTAIEEVEAQLHIMIKAGDQNAA